MCGICGIVRLDGSPADPEPVGAMAQAIVHRGPDGGGLYVDRSVALGVRRLAIIDLVAGEQPMTTPSSLGHLVFNGELYNYRALREELAAEGATFRTVSDTEVAAVALERWGPRAVERFVGMFAFAFWRSDAQRLLLARDRLGIKPLYLLESGPMLAFASEIKCFVAARLLTPVPDPTSIDTFLAFGHSVAPRTAFRDVRKVMPGELVDVQRGRVTTSTYWRPPLPAAGTPAWPAAVAEVRVRLDEAVRSHMVSDVPVGALLSGGLDSSVVVALMSRYSTAVRTYTVGFEGDEGSSADLAAARAVSDAFGTDHHELMVGPAELEGAMDTLVHHYDEPFADPAGLPTYLISRFARRDVKVLLTGEGGDELFGGYRRYVAESVIARFSMVPLAARRAVAAGVNVLTRSERGERIARAIVAPDRISRFASWIEAIPPQIRSSLYSPEFAARIQGSALARFEALFAEADGAEHLSVVQWVELRSRLADAYLEKVDKATMAVSVEARVPLLDHRLVEYVSALPSSYKIQGRSTKAIFRAAVSDLLPADILDRSKRGFDPPLDLWFSGRLRSQLREILLERRTIERGYFREDRYRTYVEGALNGGRNGAWPLWLLLNLELWHRAYVDAPAVVRS